MGNMESTKKYGMQTAEKDRDENTTTKLTSVSLRERSEYIRLGSCVNYGAAGASSQLFGGIWGHSEAYLTLGAYLIYD